MKKKLFVNCIRPCLYFFFSFFFKPQYLKGRFFDFSMVGWQWAFRSLLFQKFFRENSHIPWPVSLAIAIDDPERIQFHPDDINNFQTFGCYFSNAYGGIITIGKGTMIAPNVGIITTNHDVLDLNKHQMPKNVTLGENCWIGMGAIILPGVTLGNNTIVGANSVVTKSFSEGYVVIGGNPAKVLKNLSHGK